MEIKERRETFCVQDKLRSARLYAITLPLKGGYESAVEGACRGGADVVQLREKHVFKPDLIALAQRLARLCRRYGTLFIVNDHLDAALAAGADGVHLGQDDLDVPSARRIARSYLLQCGRSKEDFLIGCSTHSIEQALKAQAEGADYVGCGPLFATPTKPGTPPVGLDLVRAYRRLLRIPFVAIGGIDAGNLDGVAAAGATCVAAVRAVFAAADPESAARALKNRLGGAA